MPLRTPFCAVHEPLGARMVEFAGWRMPLLYTSIIAEHNHIRAAARQSSPIRTGHRRATRLDATGDLTGGAGGLSIVG